MACFCDRVLQCITAPVLDIIGPHPAALSLRPVDPATLLVGHRFGNVQWYPARRRVTLVTAIGCSCRYIHAVVRIPGNIWLTKLGDEASDGLIFLSPRLKHPTQFDRHLGRASLREFALTLATHMFHANGPAAPFKSLQKSSQNMCRHDIRGLSGHVQTACKKF
jgi:hypothetical protein